MSKLWRESPRVSRYASLTEQFTRDVSGDDADDEVSADLFFGPDETPNAIGAFSIGGNSILAFSSEVLVGPPPGVLPTAWFKRDDINRLVLVEIDYVDQTGSGDAAAQITRTAYFANAAYFDDENGRVYRDCVTSVPRFNRAISRATLRGRFTSSNGSIEIDNTDHAFDDLLKFACDGSEVRFYLGDGGDVMTARAPWPRSQFFFVIKAAVAKVTGPARGKLSVALKDSLLLDQTVGGTVAVGGTGVNANQFRPEPFGFARNVACVLQDFPSLTYVYAKSGINTTLIALRCRGDSIANADNSDGTSRLLANPAGGLVTADVLVTTGAAGVPQGDLFDTLGAYRLSDAFYQLVGVDAGLIAAGKYAGPSGNFELNGANDYHVGLLTTEPRNLVDVLNDLCDSGNVYYAVRRDGFFTFGWMRPEALDYDLPPASWSIGPTITRDSLIKGSEFKIDHADPGNYQVQGYANANWTQQTDLALGLSADVAALYQRKGYYPPPNYVPPASVGDAGSATSYSGPSDPPGYGVFKYGAPQLFHQTLKRSLDNRTLISCRSDRDALVHLGRWQLVRRSQPLPWLEFIDCAVDLSFFQVELGNVLPLDIQEEDGSYRAGLHNLRYQVCSIDIALTEGVIRLGLVRRRPAITDVYFS